METKVRTSGDLAWELMDRRAASSVPLTVSNGDETVPDREVDERIERLRSEGGEPSAGSCCGSPGGWGN